MISILIPFKNTALFLPECINSIIEQTYTNWEVIAVNDGSTDQSYAIMEAYSKKDSRIILLESTGVGIIDALKTAYKKASGTFVSRMDSDDIMTPNKLAVMRALLKKEGPNTIAIGQVKYFSDRGISNGYARYEKWLNNLTALGSNYSEIYKECVIPSPAWMCYRKDLDKVGAFNPNTYPEDYDLTFRFYKAGIKCLACNQILHHWRDYDYRTSRTSEHYAQNYFLDLKLNYFLELEYNPKRPLIIWGAGFKGKKIAKGLLEKKIPFYWICDNPKKIGKHIYEQEMLPFSYLASQTDFQSIVTVANETAQSEIRTYFASLGKKSMLDYYFFC